MTRLDEKEIIAKIQTLRKSKRITLGELARKTGLTKGYLSQIEHSSKTPPFSTLDKIAYALGVDITDFFVNHEGSRKTPALPWCGPRSGSRSRQEAFEGVTVTNPLAYKKAGKNMEPYLITVDSKSSGTFKHDGEEFLFVLDGAMEFNLRGQAVSG